MIGFVIKKAFFDTWDNLLKLVGFNFMTLPFLGIAFLGFSFSEPNPYIGFPLFFIGLIFYILHLGVISYFARDIGNCKSITYKDYFKYFKEGIKDNIKFALAWAAFMTITSFSIIYYFSGDGIMSLVPLALVFWFSIMTSIAVLFFFSIRVRLFGSFRKVIKKCFILFMDNPGVSVFTFIYTLLLAFLSLVSGGLLPPGPGAIMVLLDTVVHMYELKYDYLEKNPEANRKKIPWIELTYELNENIGPRSLKGMIFPWKD